MKKIQFLFLLSFFFTSSFLFAQPKTVETIKSESSVTYHMVHPLHKIEATSKEMDYHVEADATKKVIKNVSATVDVSTFDSGNSSRDSHAMEVIDALDYPDVTFAGSSITQNGDSVSVAGKLTFHGVTKDVVIYTVTKWSSDKLEIAGTLDISLSAFNIERPSLLMIPVEDTLHFDIIAAFKL